MRRITLSAPLALMLACSAYACGGDDNTDLPNVEDGGADGSSRVDGGKDGSTPHTDATVDTGTDTGAGHDTGTGVDTGTDTSTGEPDTGVDTGAGDDDAGTDTGAGDDASDGAADIDAADAGTGDDASDGAVIVPVDASDDADVDTGIVDAGPLTHVFVVRVGDGTAALTNAATAVFLDEIAVTPGATASRSIALPTAEGGLQHPLTLSGTATSEGFLALSQDGHSVTLAGYSTPPGTAAVNKTGSVEPADAAADAGVIVHRIVGIVTYDGTVNTSTALAGAFSGNSVRSAVTTDGTAYWVSGTGSASTGGVHYVAQGQLGTLPTSQILSSPANVRGLNIVDGNLFFSSATGAFVGVSQLGTGLPATSGSSAKLLFPLLDDAGPDGGSTTAPISPYAFVALDTDNTVGVDRIYVADDPSPGTGSIQKFVLANGSWTRVTSFTSGLAASSGFLGVTAWVNPDKTVTVLGTTTESPARLLAYTDDGVNLTPTAVVIATAPANTAFRGVVLTPTP